LSNYEEFSENIKIRQTHSGYKLLLKNQLTIQDGIIGFSEKISEAIPIDKKFDALSIEDIRLLVVQTPKLKDYKFNPERLVKLIKESMVIKLKKLPAKLEFSKIDWQGQIYLSFCAESHCLNAIKLIKNKLGFQSSSYSYQQFLKNIATW
jgi:hypothetical protein